MGQKSNVDGWQIICDYKVFVLNGQVHNGITYNGDTIYPYRVRNGKLFAVEKCSISTFRRNIMNGTYLMMYSDKRRAETWHEGASANVGRDAEKTYYLYSYKTGSSNAVMRPALIHTNGTHETGVVNYSVDTDGDYMFSMYSESDNAAADFYEMVSDVLTENARQAENIMKAANEKISAFNVVRSGLSYNFMTVEDAAEVLDNGKTISFMPETEENADGNSTEWYGAKISEDFGGRTLVIGKSGKGIVFSAPSDENGTAESLGKFLENNFHMRSDDVMLRIDVNSETAYTAHYAPPKDAAVAEMFPDYASISPGEWSSFGKTMKTVNGDSIEIGLYREPDGNDEYSGTLTLQVFIGDDVVVCEQMSERADAGGAEE